MMLVQLAERTEVLAQVFKDHVSSSAQFSEQRIDVEHSLQNFKRDRHQGKAVYSKSTWAQQLQGTASAKAAVQKLYDPHLQSVLISLEAGDVDTALLDLQSILDHFDQETFTK